MDIQVADAQRQCKRNETATNSNKPITAISPKKHYQHVSQGNAAAIISVLARDPFDDVGRGIQILRCTGKP
jgi:hypothetical protein